MELADLVDLADRLIPRTRRTESQLERPFSNLAILRHHRPTQFESAMYRPVFCLILQGRKQTLLGADQYAMGAGECLLISHDLPVIARIQKAPYLALLFHLEMGVLRDLYDELADALPASSFARSLEVQTPDRALVDALARYVALAGSPTDRAVLGPLISREIHYRLAMAPFGGMLRDLIRHDSHASAIARALAQLRRDFRTPIAVSELAKTVGMSPSAFHKHFKTLTASSPLQYQKQLRLLEARRLLRAGARSVAVTAFDVGYESATQFSREYAREFGVPPKRDLAASG